jgi:hypothetical protein
MFLLLLLLLLQHRALVRDTRAARAHTVVIVGIFRNRSCRSFNVDCREAIVFVTRQRLFQRSCFGNWNWILRRSNRMLGLGLVHMLLVVLMSGRSGKIFLRALGRGAPSEQGRVDDCGCQAIRVVRGARARAKEWEEARTGDGAWSIRHI